jgi:hypothetical protein
MRFDVPVEKDSPFILALFEAISDNLSELKITHGKWPDRVYFSGQLGKELYSFIIKAGWDLAKFNPQEINSIVNKISFEYSKPLDQIDDSSVTMMDAPLHNRVVNGFPGEKTIQKIIGAYSPPSFKIERTVRPTLEIRLFRKK